MFDELNEFDAITLDTLLSDGECKQIVECNEAPFHYCETPESRAMAVKQESVYYQFCQVCQRGKSKDARFSSDQPCRFFKPLFA